MALHEDRARDVQAVAPDRPHDAHPSLRVVAREDDDLDEALGLRQGVEVQEAPYKGESNAGREHVVQVFALVGPILLLPLLAKHRVRLRQVKQGAGCHPDDEGTLQVQSLTHDTLLPLAPGPSPDTVRLRGGMHICVLSPQDDRRGRGRVSRTDSTREKPRKKHRVIMPHSPL